MGSCSMCGLQLLAYLFQELFSFENNEVKRRLVALSQSFT